MGKSASRHLTELMQAKYFEKKTLFYPTATDGAKGSPNAAIVHNLTESMSAKHFEKDILLYCH